ncbi:uncharacterized protein LOC136024640 [Artemia franciscana]
MKDIHSPAPTQPNPLGYKTDKISNNREGLEVSKEIKNNTREVSLGRLIPTDYSINVLISSANIAIPYFLALYLGAIAVLLSLTVGGETGLRGLGEFFEGFFQQIGSSAIRPFTLIAKITGGMSDMADMDYEYDDFDDEVNETSTEPSSVALNTFSNHVPYSPYGNTEDKGTLLSYGINPLSTNQVAHPKGIAVNKPANQDLYQPTVSNSVQQSYGSPAGPQKSQFYIPNEVNTPGQSQLSPYWASNVQTLKPSPNSNYFQPSPLESISYHNIRPKSKEQKLYNSYLSLSSKSQHPQRLNPLGLKSQNSMRLIKVVPKEEPVLISINELSSTVEASPHPTAQPNKIKVTPGSDLDIQTKLNSPSGVIVSNDYVHSIPSKKLTHSGISFPIETSKEQHIDSGVPKKQVLPSDFSIRRAKLLKKSLAKSKRTLSDLKKLDELNYGYYNPKDGMQKEFDAPKRSNAEDKGRKLHEVQSRNFSFNKVESKIRKLAIAIRRAIVKLFVKKKNRKRRLRRKRKKYRKRYGAS